MGRSNPWRRDKRDVPYEPRPKDPTPEEIAVAFEEQGPAKGRPSDQLPKAEEIVAATLSAIETIQSPAERAAAALAAFGEAARFVNPWAPNVILKTGFDPVVEEVTRFGDTERRIVRLDGSPIRGAADRGAAAGSGGADPGGEGADGSRGRASGARARGGAAVPLDVKPQPVLTQRKIRLRE